MSDTVIGVYPPLPPLWTAARSAVAAFPFTERHLLLTHLGRGAVWLGLRALGLGPGRSVAMPAYHCGSEVEAARLAGVEVVFYRVDASLAADEEDLARASSAADATYVISYFGFPPPTPPPRTPVIEDMAHGLFSSGPSGPLGSSGEVAIFCPRKSLGVPDGGAVLVSQGTVAATGRAPLKRVLRSTASLAAGRAALSRRRPLRRAATTLLSSVSRADAATARGTLTEEVIGEWDLTADDMRTAASAPSRITARLARAADADQVRARRRANFTVLAAELADHCPERFRALPPGVCPLYFPVMVADRPAALARLRAGGVRATEIWPVPHPLLDRSQHVELVPLRRGLLALPLHQELEPWHMKIVVRAAKQALSR